MQSISHEPIAVSPDDAARMSGIGRTRIFEELRTGRLPSFRFGRSRLIRTADLRAFVDALAAAGQRERAE